MAGQSTKLAAFEFGTASSRGLIGICFLRLVNEGILLLFAGASNPSQRLAEKQIQVKSVHALSLIH
jgi:hypothetical protein